MNRDSEDIGSITMPQEFAYKEISEKGKPQHEKFDDFYRRHPFMDIGKRAKIFSPFDALRGFSEAVAEKEIQYQPKIILEQAQRDELNRILNILAFLTPNSRAAKRAGIIIDVTYFVACSDRNHEAYGYRGQYVTIRGICMNVDGTVTRTITVGEEKIPLDDIFSIDFLDKRLCEIDTEICE